ncbi:hypothetical protein RJ639_001895 [Escallonia herrerae]|uniref:PLAT domain-containing protein n=1 Tax=Escallonia herrerae TaxID=1293975 RepID=A0AA89BH93_9ASTE|nr:hypothetical protein RJ639_001895 [Escallonia herrerae]
MPGLKPIALVVAVAAPQQWQQKVVQMARLDSKDDNIRRDWRRKISRGYAERVNQDENEVKYEFDFAVPEEFGEIGAVLVENEHHKEMYFKNITLDGFPNGTINVTCNSWVHPKFDNPGKRVFFTNKVKETLL